jgi:predicted amidophosphoribosyltransferase
MRKIHCVKCDALLKENFDFCPYCGNKFDHYHASYKIGDNGPAGGIIFYDKGNCTS